MPAVGSSFSSDHRTSRINEVAGMIYKLDEDYSQNKNRTNENNSSLSCQVGMTRFELATPRPPDVCATGLRYIPNLANLGNYSALSRMQPYQPKIALIKGR